MATRVHATAVVAAGVELDDDVVVGPQAVVLGPAWLHAGVRVGPGAVVGTPPEVAGATQDLGWAADGPHHGVEIGAGTVVRELVTVQQGSARRTRIGADCWLLSRAYVAHDCQVGEAVTLSAGCCLAGHVTVGAGANLGMGVAVHQHRSIGAGAMVGMLAGVTRDVPPHARVLGLPARLDGVNEVGLRRAGVTDGDVDRLRQVYEQGLVQEGQLPERLRRAWREWQGTAPQKPLVRLG